MNTFGPKTIVAVLLGMLALERNAAAQASGKANGQAGRKTVVFTFPAPPSPAQGFAFIPLPAGYTPLGVAMNGTAALRDDTFYYRWRAGNLEALSPYYSGAGANGETPWQQTALTIGPGGTIAIATDTNRTPSMLNGQEYKDSCDEVLTVWPADGTGPWADHGHSFTTRNDFTDNVPFTVRENSSNDHGQIAVAEDGSVWCVPVTGVVSAIDRTFTPPANYAYFTRALSWFTKTGAGPMPIINFGIMPYYFYGVGGANLPIGGGLDDFGYEFDFVGGALVTYAPLAISRAGYVLGVSGGQTVIYRTGQPDKPAPPEGFGFWWDGQNRLNGYVLDANYQVQRALWLETGDQGAWQAYAYLPLAIPDGWQSTHAVAPGTTSPQLGLATDQSGTVHPFLALSVGLAVDANRDGQIKFACEDDSDATFETQPYRFWVNDDIDREHHLAPTGSGFSEDEEDDIDSTEAAKNNWKPDWQNNRIYAKRDLEDFARLWVSTQGLATAFQPKDNTDQAGADLYLGFQWAADGQTGTPAIKIYPAVETDGGRKYLGDPTVADQQVNFDYAMKDYRDTATPDIASMNVVGGTNFFVIPPRYFAHLSDAQPKTFFLFEGVSAGKGQLKLVILKNDCPNYQIVDVV